MLRVFAQFQALTVLANVVIAGAPDGGTEAPGRVFAVGPGGFVFSKQQRVKEFGCGYSYRRLRSRMGTGTS